MRLANFYFLDWFEEKQAFIFKLLSVLSNKSIHILKKLFYSWFLELRMSK